MTTRIARRLVQAAVAVAALYAGIGLTLGLGASGVERFCPFGGLESAWSLATRGEMSCATGEMNLTLMLALVALTLLARKSFCSWMCPMGTIIEWLGIAGRSLRGLLSRSQRRETPGMTTPPPGVDRPLRLLRLPMLAIVLAFTYATGELVFRAYDPYYVLFSMGGHEVQPWSWAIVGSVLAAGVVIPMAWCRYLCPLGAALWPLSAVGVLRVRRQASACTGCGSCDRACPHSLHVSGGDEVRSGECTLCMQCTAACGTPGALMLSMPARPTRPIPGWAVLAAASCLTVAGIAAGSVIAIPSVTRTFGGGDPPEAPARVTMKVDGIRCVDTARRASRQLESLNGVTRFTAYASRHEASIEFDAARTSVEAIRRAISSPVYDEERKQYLFHVFRVTEVNGERTVP